MPFLPVVQRELLIATRRPSVRRVRWWIAAVSILVVLVGSGLLAMTGSRNQGNALFVALAGYAFGLALLSGVLLTADSLSEERRAGTLGLLFLTDLRGYDVVMGKFMACSLKAFYSLLALLPALSLSLLMGGVTGTEFWRIALALLNALFFSLAAGICVSAHMWDAQKAMGNTLGLLLLLVGGLPLLAGLAPAFGLTSKYFTFGWGSPWYPFTFARATAYLADPSRFTWSLLASHVVAWVMLLIASWRLPRLAHDEPKFRTSRSLTTCSKPNSTRRADHRRHALDRNPVLWLMADEPAARWLVWALVLVWSAVVLGATLWGFNHALWSLQGSKACGFLLKLLVAVHACRFFTQARLNGTLEMLATTPLSHQTLVRGQWLGLARQFLWPLAVFFVVNLVPGFLALLGLNGSSASVASNNPVLTAGFATLMLGWYTVEFVGDVCALVLVGMWLALTVRKPTLAPAYTVLFVLLLPSLLCGMGILVNLTLGLVAISRLRQDFRYTLTG